MVAAAIGVAAAAGLAGSAMSSSAAKSAASKQASAANSANAVQLQEFNQQQANQAPWLNAGRAGLSTLSGLLGVNAPMDTTQNNFDAAAYLKANPDVAASSYYGSNPYQHYLDYGQNEGRSFTPITSPQTSSNDPSFGSLLKPFTYDQFTSDPGYQFQKQQGDLGLQTAAASRGQLTSSATAKGLSAYNQGLAGTSYNDAFNRYQTQNTNTFNKLATISGVGQVAANQTNQAAGQYAGAVGSNLIGAGNAAAAGTVGSANAISSGLSNAGNSLSQYSVLSNLLGGQNGGVPNSGATSFSSLGGGENPYLNGSYYNTGGGSGGGTFSLLANGG